MSLSCPNPTTTTSAAGKRKIDRISSASRGEEGGSNNGDDGSPPAPVSHSAKWKCADADEDKPVTATKTSPYQQPQPERQPPSTLGNFYCGCAGFSSSSWIGNFYPKSLVGHDSDRQLDYYQQHFRVVEINSTFYGVPSESTVHKWKKQCAKSFKIVAKAPRSVTHEGDRLSRTALSFFMSRMERLGDNLTCILIQCPRNLKVEITHLEEIRNMLKEKAAWYHGHLAFEFRNEDTYFNEEVRAFLAEHDDALVLHPDSLGRSTIGNTSLGRGEHSALKHYTPQELSNLATATGNITSSFVYLRLHGSNDEHRGEYTISQLEEVARQIRTWRNIGLDVFAFFLNDLEPTPTQQSPSKKQQQSSFPQCSPLKQKSQPCDGWCAMPKNAKQLESIVYQLSNESIPDAPKKPKTTLHNFFSGKK